VTAHRRGCRQTRRHLVPSLYPHIALSKFGRKIPEGRALRGTRHGRNSGRLNSVATTRMGNFRSAASPTSSMWENAHAFSSSSSDTSLPRRLALPRGTSHAPAALRASSRHFARSRGASRFLAALRTSPRRLALPGGTSHVPAAPRASSRHFARPRGASRFLAVLRTFPRHFARSRGASRFLAALRTFPRRPALPRGTSHVPAAPRASSRHFARSRGAPRSLAVLRTFPRRLALPRGTSHVPAAPRASSRVLVDTSTTQQESSQKFEQLRTTNTGGKIPQLLKEGWSRVFQEKRNQERWRVSKTRTAWAIAFPIIGDSLVTAQSLPPSRLKKNVSAQDGNQPDETESDEPRFTRLSQLSDGSSAALSRSLITRLKGSDFSGNPDIENETPLTKCHWFSDENK